MLGFLIIWMYMAADRERRGECMRCFGCFLYVSCVLIFCEDVAEGEEENGERCICVFFTV